MKVTFNRGHDRTTITMTKKESREFVSSALAVQGVRDAVQCAVNIKSNIQTKKDKTK